MFCYAKRAVQPKASAAAPGGSQRRRRPAVPSGVSTQWLRDEPDGAPLDGAPLDGANKAKLEHRFSTSLDAVRVHTGERASAAASQLGAQAFTIGRHIVFGAGQYRPNTPTGSKLLAHEVTHTVQQGFARAPAAAVSAIAREHPAEVEARRSERGGGTVHPSSLAAPAIALRNSDDALDAGVPATTLDRVTEALSRPDPIAGVGDFSGANAILVTLGPSELLDVCDALLDTGQLEPLEEFLAGGHGAGRVEFAALAVRLGQGVWKQNDARLARTKALASTVSADDLAAVEAYLGRHIDQHRTNLVIKGNDAELVRLGRSQLDFLEKKRQLAEQKAKQEAEQEAKKKGVAPPPPKKVSVADVIKQQGDASNVVKNEPVDQWKNLSDADKADWSNRRVPKVWKDIGDAAQGTELEQVLRGKSYRFEPEEILKNGWYAYQSGSALAFGMGFVTDAEAGIRNVLPIVAHELGGHFEYGSEYGKSVAEKAIELLPVAERSKVDRKALYYGFAYIETEIFAELRERRYAHPGTGKDPKYGGDDPDWDVPHQLDQLKDAYAPEVIQALLSEIWMKVNAASEILPRDKKYFRDLVETKFSVKL